MLQSTDDLEPAAIHDVLRNHRRRLVLDIVRDVDDFVSVRELSERIGAIESGLDPAPRAARQSAYVSLLQTHLPKLDALGIVEYEVEGRLVRAGEGLDEVTGYLETVPSDGLARAEYYAAISLLGPLIVAAAELGTPGIAEIPVTVWAAAFLGLIFLSGLYHTLRQNGALLQRALS